MVKIKICGITRPEDGLLAAEAGADAIGFMFFAGSRRFIDVARAREIASVLPPFITKVGVFVDPEPAFLQAVLREGIIDAIQLHGSEPAGFARGLAKPVIKAFRIQTDQSLVDLAAYDRETWLLDSFVPGQLGGTGAVFNWDLAIRAKEKGRPIILAGGLTPENVSEAVRRVEPYGVDVSSGVESQPGIKDPEKVQTFVRAAHGA